MGLGKLKKGDNMKDTIEGIKKLILALQEIKKIINQVEKWNLE